MHMSIRGPSQAGRPRGDVVRGTLEASLRLELPLGLADEGRRPSSFEKGDAFDVRVEDYHR